MKLFKISSILSMLAVILFTVSCKENDTYEWAKVNRDQVYFDTNLAATTISLSSNLTSFSIPVYRAKTENPLSAPIKVTFQEGSKYSCANASVDFAYGSNVSKLLFTFNPEDIEFDKVEEITVEVDDEAYVNDYGLSKATFKVTMPAPWVKLGKGVYIENYYWEFSMGIDIYQNMITPNLYRMVNPYATIFAANDMAVTDDASDYLYFQIINKGETVPGDNQVVDFDGLVFFYGDGPQNSLNTGYLHSSYNDVICLAYPYWFNEHDTPDTWAHNKVLDYKPDGTVGAIQLAPYYYMWSKGGWNGADEDGSITIYMPGYDPKDYSVAIETVGRLIDTKENGQAVFNVTLGEDVEYAKVAFDAGKDPNVPYEQIYYGDDAVITLTESGEVRFPYDGPGDYVCLVMGYDANGNEQEYAYAVINIPANGAPETYTAYYIGTYQHGVQSLVEDGSLMWYMDEEETIPYYDDAMILYGCDSNDSKYMLSPWINVGWEENGTAGQGMVFYMNEDGSLTVPGSMTGVNSKYGEIWGWDLISANVANYPSYYDANEGMFVFYLAWSVEAGNFGYTVDTYTLTGYAEAAPRNLPGKLSRKAKSAPVSVKSFKKKMTLDSEKTLSPVTKKAPKFECTKKNLVEIRK